MVEIVFLHHDAAERCGSELLSAMPADPSGNCDFHAHLNAPSVKLDTISMKSAENEKARSEDRALKGGGG